MLVSDAIGVIPVEMLDLVVGVGGICLDNESLLPPDEGVERKGEKL